MNLPEGYLLQVLQEQFGPHVGADPLALLSVIGRNMVGRVQVAAAGVDLDKPPRRLKSRNYCRETTRRGLCRTGAQACGQRCLWRVAELSHPAKEQASDFEQHKKASVLVGRHILKGSTSKLPFRR